MNFLMTLFVGLATLVWGVFASVPLTRNIQWTNTSTTTTTTTTIVTVKPSTWSGTGIPSGNLTITVSKTTSAEPPVYTIPSNYTVPNNESVEPIQWHLYSLQAFADRDQQIAQ